MIHNPIFDVNWENVLTIAESGGDYDSVDAAIDAADDGQVLLILPGTYEEPSNAYASEKVITKRLTLYGLGSDITIIRGSYLVNAGGSLNLRGVSIYPTLGAIRAVHYATDNDNYIYDSYLTVTGDDTSSTPNYCLGNGGSGKVYVYDSYIDAASMSQFNTRAAVYTYSTSENPTIELHRVKVSSPAATGNYYDLYNRDDEGTIIVANVVYDRAKVSGAISGARTIQALLPAQLGYSNTSASVIHRMDGIALAGVPLPDGENARAATSWVVPQSYVSGMQAEVVLIAGATGNGYVWSQYHVGAEGENWDQDVYSTSWSTIALTQDQNFVGQVRDLDVAPGDLLVPTTWRDATNAGDTVNGAIRVAGWLLTFTVNEEP